MTIELLKIGQNRDFCFDIQPRDFTFRLLPSQNTLQSKPFKYSPSGNEALTG
jgi:hypothetical protein